MLIVYRKVVDSKTPDLPIFSYIFELVVSLYIFLNFERMHSINKSQLSSWIKITEDFYLDPDGLLGKGCFG